VDINAIEEAPDLLTRVVIVQAFRQVHFLFVGRADETPRVAGPAGHAMERRLQGEAFGVRALVGCL